MADNGSAESLFNDRRGSNPYAPTDSRRARAPKVDWAQLAANDTSYNGRGTRSPNGEQPATRLNGRTVPREDPDVAGRRKALLRLGEKGQS